MSLDPIEQVIKDALELETHFNDQLLDDLNLKLTERESPPGSDLYDNLSENDEEYKEISATPYPAIAYEIQNIILDENVTPVRPLSLTDVPLEPIKPRPAELYQPDFYEDLPSLNIDDQPKPFKARQLPSFYPEPTETPVIPLSLLPPLPKNHDQDFISDVLSMPRLDVDAIKELAESILKE